MKRTPESPPPRPALLPLRRWLTLGAGLLGVLSLGQAWTDLFLARRAQVVLARLDGVPAEAYTRIQVSRVLPAGGERELACFVSASKPPVWRLEAGWVRRLRVRLQERDLAELTAIQLRIGEQVLSFRKPEIRQLWTCTRSTPVLPTDQATWTLETPERLGAKSPASLRNILLNWPATETILQELLLLLPSPWRSLAATVAVLLLTLVTGRMLTSKGEASIAWTALDGATEAKACTARQEWAWSLAGLLIVVAVLVRLQLADPFWFTQDDNRVQFLPNVLFGCRAALAGQLPTWSPHELLGTPLMEPGHYPLTYPPLYLCHFVARKILGQEQQILQVWAWIHLTLGYLAAYVFARFVGIRPALAAAAASSFVLSGFFLILGRAWTGPTPVALWLPIMSLPVALLLAREPDWRLVPFSGLAIGGAFHSANTQFWAYSLVVLAGTAAVAATSESFRRQRLPLLLSGLLLGLAIAAPVLIPQLDWVFRLHRSGGVHWGILSFFPRLLLPSPLVDAFHRDGWSSRGDALGHLFYSGTVLTLVGCAALGLLVGASLSGLGCRILRRNIWLTTAGLAMLLAMGQDGPLWCLLAALPGFSMLNHPIKLLPQMTFFLSIGAAIILERLLTARSSGVAAERTLFGCTALLLLFHASPSLPPFTEWRFPLPYPPLPGLVATEGRPGAVGAEARYIPLAQAWDRNPDNLWSLSFGLPAHYGLLSADGYNPLVQASPENVLACQRMIADPLAAARAYGIRWALQRRGYRPPTVLRDLSDAADMTTSKYDSPLLADSVFSAGKLVAETEGVRVWELPRPDPLAFARRRPELALPVTFRADGVDVELSGATAGSPVVVNVLMRPAMRGRIDGIEVPLASDEWGRVVAELPAGARKLELRYCPRWQLGFAAAGLLTALALGLAGWLARRRPQDAPATAGLPPPGP